MFLHVHALWPAVAAAVNRDDRGRQKTTIIGGVPRARWSSQSQKARTREAFAMTLDATAPLTRTWSLITDALTSRGTPPAWASAAAKLTWELTTGGDKNLVLVADTFADTVCAAITEHEQALRDEYALRVDPQQPPADDADPDAVALYEQQLARKDDVQQRLKDKDAKKTHRRSIAAVVAALAESGGNVDIAVNGRMIAEHPRFNVDPAVSVAHGVSVEGWHESNVDYFTAYDRLADPHEGSTVGMIDTRPNGSVLYYRYAAFDITTAAANLHTTADDVIGHATAWARVFTDALPIGYRSSTAAFAPPVLAGTCVSANAHGSLVAFLDKPITGHDQYRQATTALLAQHHDNQGYARTGTLRYWSSKPHDTAETTHRHDTYDDVLAAATADLTEAIDRA